MNATARAFSADRGGRPFIRPARRRALVASLLDRSATSAPDDPRRVLAARLRAGEVVELDGVWLGGLVPGIDHERRYQLDADGTVTTVS